jgi:hypothetical protein
MRHSLPRFVTNMVKRDGPGRQATRSAGTEHWLSNEIGRVQDNRGTSAEGLAKSEHEHRHMSDSEPHRNGILKVSADNE